MHARKPKKANFAAILKRYGLTTTDVADCLGVSGNIVRMWRSGERRISPARALVAERRLRIPRHELRPDLWAPPAPASPKSRLTPIRKGTHHVDAR